jgi:hypothetical protein
MNTAEITDQLERIASVHNFVAGSAALTESWSAAHVGIEAIEPVLQFIERHPDIDFGTPGPLVHFVEQYYGQGYEEKLLQSLARKPTMLTVWMLNRVINGTEEPARKRPFLETLDSARRHHLADHNVVQLVDEFLARNAN